MTTDTKISLNNGSNMVYPAKTAKTDKSARKVMTSILWEEY